MEPIYPPDAMRLYDRDGRRLYCNRAERSRFRTAIDSLPAVERAYCLTLLHTGCRLSEARALGPAALQPEAQVLTIRTLKRRALHMREVPIPPELVAALIALIEDDANYTVGARLWPIDRIRAYRWIKRAMAKAEISGTQACPKGLRHGYAIHALGSGVPLNMVSKWMGHASLTTTAIYANAVGPEQLAIASRMWAKEDRPSGEG
jgi:integrase/recombinase XerD